MTPSQSPRTPLPPRGRSKEAPPKRGGFGRFARAMLWLVALLLIGTAGYAAYLAKKADTIITKVGTSEPVTATQSAKVKPIAVLLLGLDTRKETGSLNTDVMMVAALNPKDKTATVVSIPRDTLLKAKNGKSGKANSFYSSYTSGGWDKARTEMKALIGDYLQIPINYVSLINFQFFSDLVDSLGGVTVDVDMDMRYKDDADGTNINLKKGVHTLSGKQALDFVRYRKSNDGKNESSDFERNERQQKVIAAILEKAKSPASLTKIGSMMDAAGNNLRTDIPSKQIYDMLTTYLGIGGDKIKYIHLSGEWKSPYVYIDPAQLQEARKALKAQLTVGH